MIVTVLAAWLTGSTSIVDGLHPVDPRGANGGYAVRKLSRRVCLIDRADGSEATGFLVGPDLMLTTAHALMGTEGIFADPLAVDTNAYEELPALPLSASDRALCLLDVEL